jgi:hypothetical protein
MPKATANIAEPERHELKSLPEGFVLVRRLTYGQKLERRAMSSNASAETQGRSGKGNLKLTMQMVNQAATLFDFTHCIVDHNLEGDDGQKLNLSSPMDIQKLDPRVGDEIEKILDGINNFEEDDEELGN